MPRNPTPAQVEVSQKCNQRKGSSVVPCPVPSTSGAGPAAPATGASAAAGANQAEQPAPESAPLSACRREWSVLPNDPEKDAADLAQPFGQAVAYGNLSGLTAGGAKRAQKGDETLSKGAHSGAETAQSSSEKVAKAATVAVERPVVVLAGTVEESGSAGASVPAGVDQPEGPCTDVVPLSACRREWSVLPNDPEKDAADLAQLPERVEAYANATALGVGGAKPAQRGEQTVSKGAQCGAETAHDSRPFGEVQHDPRRAVMEQYPREFDELPTPSIIWSDGRSNGHWTVACWSHSGHDPYGARTPLTSRRGG